MIKELHECNSCGHTWFSGQHGGHDCKGNLLKRIAELEEGQASAIEDDESFHEVTGDDSFLGSMLGYKEWIAKTGKLVIAGDRVVVGNDLEDTGFHERCIVVQFDNDADYQKALQDEFCKFSMGCINV